MALPVLVRRDEFDPVERMGRFAELTARFLAKVESPPEVTGGIAHEQSVRNALDVVYRTRLEPAGKTRCVMRAMTILLCLWLFRRKLRA